MDKFETAKLFLMLTMIGALIFSSFSHPKDVSTDEYCMIFPQFVTAASSGKDHETETAKPKITYSFGLAELLAEIF